MRGQRNRTIVLAACLVTAAAFALPAAGANGLETEAQQAITNFKQHDPGLQKFFDDSVGYAVFPSVSQGAAIVGATHGKGIVYENGKAVGEATVTKVSVGAQLGGQSFSELIFFRTSQALQDFKGGNQSITANVSGVIAGQGAAEHAKFQQGVAVFTLPKSGVMGRAAVGGQTFAYEPFK
jgi:lipid-binding SYLF domain-containing protein